MFDTKNIPANDKLKHMYAGLLITLISFFVTLVIYFLSYFIFNHKFDAFIFCAIWIPATLIGIIKEIQDKKTKGKRNFEFLDMVATAAPGITIAVKIFILILIMKS